MDKIDIAEMTTEEQADLIIHRLKTIPMTTEEQMMEFLSRKIREEIDASLLKKMTKSIYS